MGKASVSESNTDVCDSLIFSVCFGISVDLFQRLVFLVRTFWGAQCPLHLGGDPLKPAGSGRHIQREHSKTGVLRGKLLVRSMAKSKDES